MLTSLIGVVIILQLLTLYWVKPKKAELPPELNEVLPQVFKDCGLNVEHFRPDYDLIPTGKLGDIIFHAAARLGKPIRTVQDVHDLLVK
jgi:hypothetical protein